MSNPKSIFLYATSFVLVAGVALAFQEDKRVLSDKDLTKFSNSLGDYFEAKAKTKGVLVAEADVAEEATDLEKKLVKKKAASADILGNPYDLGQALWLSHDYNRNKKVKAGKVSEATFKERYYSKENPLKYTVAVPNDYKPKTGWPLILAIPPVDQKPSEHLGEDWESGDFRDGSIIAIPKMPENTESWMERDGTAAILTTLQQVLETHAVDPNRVYLAGTGEGVKVALSIAGRRGWAFAGVIGRRGDAGENVDAAGFCNLPTFLAGGGAQASAFEEKVKELEFNNCKLEATAELADIWAWITANPRNSYPSSLEFWPSLSLVRSNWVEIDRGSASDGAHVKASIDAGSNTITVDGTGVPSVTLHLSDALVDLDRPLRIVANGVSKEVKVVRSRRRFLDMAYYSQLDPGQVYVASELVDLPAVQGEEGEEGAKDDDGTEDK